MLISNPIFFIILSNQFHIFQKKFTPTNSPYIEFDPLGSCPIWPAKFARKRTVPALFALHKVHCQQMWQLDTGMGLAAGFVAVSFDSLPKIVPFHSHCLHYYSLLYYSLRLSNSGWPPNFRSNRWQKGESTVWILINRLIEIYFFQTNRFHQFPPSPMGGPLVVGHSWQKQGNRFCQNERQMKTIVGCPWAWHLHIGVAHCLGWLNNSIGSQICRHSIPLVHPRTNQSMRGYRRWFAEKFIYFNMQMINTTIQNWH